MTDYSKWPVLRRGMKNMAVQTVRGALKGRGYEPGYSVFDPNLFDAWVEASVIDFQKKNGLNADGVVGVNTWTALLGSGSQPNTGPGPNADASQLTTDTSSLDVGLASGQVVTLTDPATGKTGTFTVPPGTSVQAIQQARAQGTLSRLLRPASAPMSMTMKIALGVGALLVIYLLTQKRKSLI